MSKALAMILGALLCGCTNAPINAPQSGAVESGLSRVQTGVSTAQTQNSDIVKYNAVARATNQRVQDKVILETRYREYRAKHPRPTPSP